MADIQRIDFHGNHPELWRNEDAYLPDRIMNALNEWAALSILGEIRDAKTPEDAFAHMKTIETLTQQDQFNSPAVRYIKRCVYLEILQRFNKHEQNTYEHFEDALPELIPGASLIEVPLIKGHTPDFFVTYHGEIAPVEIKIGSFTQKAVKQLTRYMRIYKSKHGFAIARTLVGALAPGMHFCAWSIL